jgi:hypothetical protein
MKLTRRRFIVTGSLVAAGAALGGSADAAAGSPKKGKHKRRGPKSRSGHHTIFRLSVRGRRASQAAKRFCANFRFKTKNAAARYPRPHPRINARTVSLVVSGDELFRLFGRNGQVADLRQLHNVTVVGVRPR